MLTKTHKQNAEKFVRELIVKDPNISLLSILREAKNSGHAMHKDDAVRLRIRVRNEIRRPKLSLVKESTTVERRQFLNQLLDKEPSLNARQAAAKLKEHFGLALDMGYINTTVKVAHALQEALKNAPPPTPVESVSMDTNFVNALQNSALSNEEMKIFWSDGLDFKGHVVKEKDLKDEIRRLVMNDGVKPETIEVWRRVPIQVKVDIQLS